MNIRFPSADETSIKQQVEAGLYSNATELVRDAVRRLREDSQRRAAFRAALQVGEDQIARGQYRAYTLELFEDIKRNARAKAQLGQQPNPDVLP